MTAATAAENGGAHDFDFLFGSWNVAHRRLRQRLVGDSQREEYAGTATCAGVLDGTGNLEQLAMPTKGYSGATLRLFDPATGNWSLYWADSRTGKLCPPVVGRFQNGRGEFFGDDTEGGHPVRVRFIWSQVTPTSARWEQAFSLDAGKSWETNWIMEFTRNVAVLGDFPVVEFRRYTIKEGEREQFARYFEGYFPESFQQLGSVAGGSFFNRDSTTGFTWIRGYHTIESRAVVNAAFYYGPVWREHRTTLNDLITDSDNVLLLHALSTERRITILPAVDPVTEVNGAQGVVVAQIFALKPGSVDTFARQAEPVFAAYRAAGAREAGVLVTLDVVNNFPQLPVRSDGPYLVWLGILCDNAMLQGKFAALVEQSLRELTATGLLRGTPETLILDPTPRSRLRWLPEEKQ